MRRKTQNSPQKDKNTSEYKKFAEEKHYKRYAENIKMFPINDKPKRYDQYDDLVKTSKKLLEVINPAIKETQEKIDNYNPKPFGEKRTYIQDWPSYNQAQMREKVLLISILNELLDNIPFPETKRGVGRNPIPTKDKLFYLVLQAYNIKSSRRCIADLELCKQLGFIEKAPHFNTILKCLRNTTLETYFKHLINVSGLPLQQVEMDFAVDSSGFSTSLYDRWFDARIGKESDKRRFRKVHLTCGVKTNVISAANITKGTYADSPQFSDLIHATGKVFAIREVSADKGYSSRENLETVQNAGGIAFIPFKSNTTGKQRGSEIWRKMYLYYTNKREEFLMHYHKRSNVESTFNMIKRKFGDHLRSKNEVSQNNEILAKCLAHNLCVLIQESLELGIELDFEKCAEIPIAT